MITLTDNFYPLVNGTLKRDLIKRLIKLIDDYIKRLSLYILLHNCNVILGLKVGGGVLGAQSRGGGVFYPFSTLKSLTKRGKVSFLGEKIIRIFGESQSIHSLFYPFTN
jgi:hypothetical protein